MLKLTIPFWLFLKQRICSSVCLRLCTRHRTSLRLSVPIYRTPRWCWHFSSGFPWWTFCFSSHSAAIIGAHCFTGDFSFFSSLHPQKTEEHCEKHTYLHVVDWMIRTFRENFFKVEVRGGGQSRCDLQNEWEKTICYACKSGPFLFIRDRWFGLNTWVRLKNHPSRSRVLVDDDRRTKRKKKEEIIHANVNKCQW